MAIRRCRRAPKLIVYFFRDVHGARAISKEFCATEPNDYHRWTRVRCGNNDNSFVATADPAAPRATAFQTLLRSEKIR